MNSSLCQGWVSHRRWAPRAHAFRYRLGMLYLDLAEQAEVFGLSRLLVGRWRCAPLCWREQDYLPAYTGQGLSLADAVRRVLREALGDAAPDGAIHLLTQPRSWGLSFNPVSFFLCFDSDGKLAAVLCEVTNTPWLERHHYVLPMAQGKASDVRVAKAFHVSPFLPRDLEYRMRFLAEGPHLRIRMEDWRGEEKLFQADLWLQRQPLDAKALRRHLLAFPWMTLRTVTAIYWQALRLLLKRTPIFTHQAATAPLSVAHPPHEESRHAKP